MRARQFSTLAHAGMNFKLIYDIILLPFYASYSLQAQIFRQLLGSFFKKAV
jgi:hypothetical protein